MFWYTEFVKIFKNQRQPHKNTFFVKCKCHLVIIKLLEELSLVRSITLGIHIGGGAKLTAFSKSEGHVDDDLSASCFLCLTNEQQTPCTTEQVTVPNADVDKAVLRTVPVPTGAQICLAILHRNSTAALVCMSTALYWHCNMEQRFDVSNVL